MGRFHIFPFLYAFSLIATSASANPSFSLEPRELDILSGHTKIIKLLVQDLTQDVTATLEALHTGLLEIEPDAVLLKPSLSQEVNIEVTAIDAGYTTITFNVTPQVADTFDTFVRVTSLHSYAIFHLSEVFGWMYSIAWTVSFYPQIYDNWKRKSVVGLNFDYVALNVLGYVAYSLFNCGLYWIPEMRDEYFDRHPRGMIPVLPNDILFTLHALLASTLIAVQSIIYESAGQRISWTARIIMIFYILFIGVSCIVAGVSDSLHWLDVLYFCSYVKLTITLIKYLPQAYMNYKRKSTVGWSIEKVFLDLIGGCLSMLQMFLNAHNYNDWQSLFGDPTKFGLGLFSVVFDMFFMFQHYVLYGAPAAATDIGDVNVSNKQPKGEEVNSP